MQIVCLFHVSTLYDAPVGLSVEPAFQPLAPLRVIPQAVTVSDPPRSLASAPHVISHVEKNAIAKAAELQKESPVEDPDLFSRTFGVDDAKSIESALPLPPVDRVPFGYAYDLAPLSDAELRALHPTLFAELGF